MFMRAITKLTVVALAGLTLGAAAAYAQTATQGQSNCGIETWSTDKQTYVTMPCNSAAGGQSGQAVSGGKASGGSASSNCGIETWSTDQQTYVSTPCPGGTTYENPSASASENINNK
jgi:hypothetical protein